MLFAALLGAGLCFGFSSAANAQEGVSVFYGYGAGSGYFGDHGRASMYTTGLVPTPPYFAIHPPVYYSVPVPRPYGYSPYAYPAYVQTPAPAKSEPVAHVNPFVEPLEKSEPVAPVNRSTASPRVQANPFAAEPSIELATAGK
jgi:hypothetical protein